MSVFFLNDVQPVHGPGATQGRGVQCKWYSVCKYARKITFKPKFEQVEIVVTGEASSKNRVPLRSRSRVKAARL